MAPLRQVGHGRRASGRTATVSPSRRSSRSARRARRPARLQPATARPLQKKGMPRAVEVTGAGRIGKDRDRRATPRRSPPPARRRRAAREFRTGDLARLGVGPPRASRAGENAARPQWAMRERSSTSDEWPRRSANRAVNFPLGAVPLKTVPFRLRRMIEDQQRRRGGAAGASIRSVADARGVGETVDQQGRAPGRISSSPASTISAARRRRVEARPRPDTLIASSAPGGGAHQGARRGRRPRRFATNGPSAAQRLLGGLGMDRLQARRRAGRALSPVTALKPSTSSSRPTPQGGLGGGRPPLGEKTSSRLPPTVSRLPPPAPGSRTRDRTRSAPTPPPPTALGRRTSAAANVEPQAARGDDDPHRQL